MRESAAANDFSIDGQETEILSKDLRRVVFIFSVLTVVGILILALHARALNAATTSLLWGLACLATGGAIGFLFGIPRTLQNDRPITIPSRAIGYRQQVNTNLEQISDWVTKIIVGLGLVHLTSIEAYFNRLAETLAAGLGDIHEHFAFSLAEIVYFLVVGFLFGYLATRLFLAGAFSRADQGAIVFEEVRSLAAKLPSDEFKQVILRSTPETFVKTEAAFREEPMTERGEGVSEDVDEEAGEDENESESLEENLAQLKPKA